MAGAKDRGSILADGLAESLRTHAQRKMGKKRWAAAQASSDQRIGNSEAHNAARVALSKIQHLLVKRDEDALPDLRSRFPTLIDLLTREEQERIIEMAAHEQCSVESLLKQSFKEFFARRGS